eukprot:GSMAST32.ASY1.ANO1.1741.1 assembled CDS
MEADDGKAIVQVLADVLQKLVAANDNVHHFIYFLYQQGDTGKVTKFHALRLPSINISDYLRRIAKYASCSAECFVLALVYIDRLIQRNNFIICSLNIHRVIITSVMLAAKFFDDHYYNNAYYAKIGGVPCDEMNSLEIEYLFLINFSLFVSPSSYSKYFNELCSHANISASPKPNEWQLAGLNTNNTKKITQVRNNGTNATQVAIDSNNSNGLFVKGSNCTNNSTSNNQNPHYLSYNENSQSYEPNNENKNQRWNEKNEFSTSNFSSDSNPNPRSNQFNNVCHMPVAMSSNMNNAEFM